MSSLAGSKRPAETPFASPTKAVASTKRSRTHYDYYDEDDVESSPEEEEEDWSGDDSDSSSIMDLDDGEIDIERFMPHYSDEFSPEDLDEHMRPHWSGQATYLEDLEVAKVPRETIPPPTETTTCRCGTLDMENKACSNCTCSKWGYKCQVTICGCQAGPYCQNPFNDFDTEAVFGPEPVILHPCFISWMLKQQEFGPEKFTRRFLFDIAFTREDSIEMRNQSSSNPYRGWKAKWDRLPTSEQDADPGIALQQQLNRIAFTDQKSTTNTFYSFCRKQHWRDDDGTWHCRVCGECVGWQQWHCGKCDKCIDVPSLQCNGCGGVDILYHEYASTMG